ncbi:uncharacterized protein LOC104895140 [Beta vulgaris subsp. vulgaris]|uniref:uncharacterized protein LOC104895140 n=1 Tax=Beta vulgaris subsp. vulgaris TaxID=3555 RepID=UPI0020374C1E|nr:uncharacterized protein LOC104895140 [Beta vulgaris subsp. vulgaris]
MADGKDGDWECDGCKNNNYAFRSFCNRCKQPRLLVDTKTPPDSKWLPRIGDWICVGCTNNNYASREKCKKCGQPKEVTAMPAIPLPGVLSRAQGGLLSSMGMLGASTFQRSLPSTSNWSSPNMYGANNVDYKDWRSGDWMCICGFHNYSSRTQCKECNAAAPALGMKRLATDEPLHDWDNKRLNAGDGLAVNQYMQSYPGFGPVTGFIGDQKAGLYPTFTSGSVVAPPHSQGFVQLPHQLAATTLMGKGAKQWRDGDWMCSKCNNHNYASRYECNRCKTTKTAITEPVSVT